MRDEGAGAARLRAAGGLTSRSKTRWRRETTMVTIKRVELVSTNILQRGAGAFGMGLKVESYIRSSI
jgi:hypothetical protein